MDSTLPAMPIMMEAGMGDMFDVMGNDAISMRGKTRQGHNELSAKSSFSGSNRMSDRSSAWRSVEAISKTFYGRGSP